MVRTLRTESDCSLVETNRPESFYFHEYKASQGSFTPILSLLLFPHPSTPFSAHGLLDICRFQLCRQIFQLKIKENYIFNAKCDFCHSTRQHKGHLCRFCFSCDRDKFLDSDSNPFPSDKDPQSDCQQSLTEYQCVQSVIQNKVATTLSTTLGNLPKTRIKVIGLISPWL